jgi:type I restriction enzyme S subunit
MSEEKELPEGWVKTQLGSFANILGGSTPSRAEPRYFGGNIVWLTPTEIPKGTVSIISDSREKLTEDGFNESGVRWIPKGSVLLTSRASIGYVAIAGTQLTTNQGFASFVLPNGIESKYFGWWLKSQKDLLENLAGGTTFKEISKATLKEVYAPIAPTNEQQLIVSAIEERFTILDAVTTTLQQNKQKLKLSRASVLKHAVEGKLTEKWRAEHPATESGQQLLERILTERRAKWEAEQLAKGKDPKKLRYEEPKEPDVSELPELPEGWFWATVEQIGDASEQVVLTGPFGSNLGKEDFIKSGVPVLTIGCLTDKGINLEKAFYVSEEKAHELDRYRVKTGDLLFSRMASVGRADLVSSQFRGAIINYHLMRLRLANIAVDPIYFISYVRGSRVLIDYIKDVNHGVTRDGINTNQLLKLPVAIAPLAEQQQIVAEVERRLSVIEQAEAAIETSLKRIERARQSILEQAFSGRLVPQDPHDEPASVLLERIQQERTRRVMEGKQRGSNGGVKVARGKKAKEQEFVPQWQLLKDAQPSELLDGSLSSVSAYENGATEKDEVEQGEMGKQDLGDLVQMPLLLWD